MEANAPTLNAGKILIIDDDHDVLMSARMLLKGHFQYVRSESDPASIREIVQDDPFDVVLLDMNFNAGDTSGNDGMFWLQKIRLLNPDAAVIMMTAFAGIGLAVQAMKEGAVDFVTKPWNNKDLLHTVSSASGIVRSRKEQRHRRAQQVMAPRVSETVLPEIIGNSQGMTEVCRIIGKVGPTEANVLILGENGTGKELLSRALHQHSARNRRIFLSVDMGAIPESLFASELFGHMRGAFTDARDDRQGRFEEASGGTLFLDEIGNLSMPMQAKLLQVLQNREVVRVGSNKPLPVDIRLICASNMPLHEMVTAGLFRQDLLYRINTVELHVPPLRERPQDIHLLAAHFLKIYATKYQKQIRGISPEALERMQHYPWPGNVRELQHVMERGVIMSEGQLIGPNDILPETPDQQVILPEILNLEEIEQTTIRHALSKHSGNLSRAARELGLGRTTLYRKLSKYRI